MSYKLCKISASLLMALAVAGFCSGCANSNIYDKLEDTFQKTSDSSNVLDTYVDDVLTPEYGSVSEDDYNSDIPTGVMTSCICSNPYGLDDVETVYFYLPESKVIDLPEEYVNWVNLSGSTNSNPDKLLGSYGLYNVNGQQGFSSSYGSTDYSDLVFCDERISTESDYILPESSTKVYTADELSGLTADQLRIARNEIYARHHYMFDDEDLQEYFYSCVWYFGMIPSDEFDSSVLSDIEKKNIEVINNAESK